MLVESEEVLDVHETNGFKMPTLTPARQSEHPRDGPGDALDGDL